MGRSSEKPPDTPVARFFRWHWAPSVLLVSGSLGFAIAAVTLIPSGARPPSFRAVELGEPSAPAPSAVSSERGARASPREPRPIVVAGAATLDGARVRADKGVMGLFPSTPAFELPPPLEEPEPPPEPEPQPVPTEMSVPPLVPGESREFDAAP
jgi:hypothetical protein